MDYFKEEISISNVENIVGNLSREWRGNEKWLYEFVLEMNDKNKKLRDDLRENKNSWTLHQYKIRLAYHYYGISALFNKLHMKHQLDAQSIVVYLEKCLQLLGEIPTSLVTSKVVKLQADAEEYLVKSNELCKALRAQRAKLRTQKREEYVSLCAALGDVAGNKTIGKWLETCDAEEREQWLKKLQNLGMARAVMFLEDSFTRQIHEKPLVMSNLLFSLGCAYETVGIPFLSARYQNTAQELLKSVLESKNAADDKQNIKNILAENIKDGTSLERVCHIIEETYSQPLSVIDQAYITRKYLKICFKQFVEETVEFLQDEASNIKDRRTIHDILEKLRGSETLLQIPHPLDQSVRYRLLKENYPSLNKEDEIKWMNILKRESFVVLIDFVNESKKELHFLEALVDFLGQTKDTKYLENKWNLHQVCANNVSLSEIIHGVLDLDVNEMGEELRAVQAAAAPLRDVKDLFYEDKFKDFIIDYFKPAKIQMVEVDGRNVLEVTGVKIVLSDVVREDVFKEILNDTSCEEVRFVGGKSVHADDDFRDSTWHGKNLVVLTRKILVHNKVVWDVSGKDSTLVYKSSAGRLSDGTGKQGDDGEAGESGGNVLVLVDEMLNPQDLTILSNGGKGGNGQDGGDGEDGQDGKGITKEEFNTKFPPASKFQLVPRLENVKTTLISIRELGTITYKWYERPVSEVSRWIPGATFYKHVVASDVCCFEKNFDNIIKDLNYTIDRPMDDHNRMNGNIFVQAESPEGNKVEFSFQRPRDSVFCQSYLLFKGAHGKPGSKGGAPGLGGQGGFGGEVVLRNPKDITVSFNVIIQAQAGSEGANGKGGKYGKFGKTGCDMGYLDYAWSEVITSKWPKYYGDGENSTVELTYHESSSTYNVWSPHRRYKNEDKKYVGMGESGIVNHKSRQHDEKATVNENQERRANARATKKKTISQASILSKYQHLLGSNEAASLEKLFSQIDKTNQDLLQAIAHTTTTKSEMSTRAEFTRCATYSEKKKSKVSEDSPKPMSALRIDTKLKLIRELEAKPMPLVAWAALGSMHLTKEETVLLASIFNSLYPSSNSEKVRNIKKVFFEKYRFSMLNSISKILRSRNDQQVIAEIIDEIKVMKYLKVVQTYDSLAHHWDLGTLSQFFYIDGNEERKKLSHYIKHSLRFEKGYLIVFRSFVLALGNSSSSSEDLKACFNEYDTYLKKKERGLIVFPESFSRIDRRHSENEKIIRDIRKYIMAEGCLTLPCTELLAHIFNVNIRLYKESSSQYGSFSLEGSYNARRGQTKNRVLHFLLQFEKLKALQVDWEYFKLDQRRKILGTQCQNILCDTKKLHTWESVEEYYASRKFLDECYSHDFEGDEDWTSPSQRKINETRALNGILEKFDDEEDKALLGTRLSKISSYIPGDVVHSIHTKILYEGVSISVHEFCCLINAVIMSFAEADASYEIYRWIISAYPQDQWIDQILLMDVETFCRKSLPSGLKDKWEGYLSKIRNKRILMQLLEKLETTTMADPDSEKCIGDILHMLSEIPGDFHPGELGLAEWPSALKEKYWSFKLTEITEWKDPVELSTHSYYLLSIENNHGDELVQMLLEVLISRKHQLTLQLLTTVLTCFYNETWDLSNNEIAMLKNAGDVGHWVESMKKKFHVDGKERDLRRLCELVGSNANTSETVKILLPTIRTRLANLEGLTITRRFYSYNLDKSENCKKAIRDYNESDIDKWLKAFSGALKSADDDISRVQSNVEDIFIEMLDVVDSAVYLKRGFRLRDTQKLAVMILLKNDKSTLAQVATGEGKSLIVVAVAVIKAIIGGKVDIITSSSVLAKRDAENNKDLYNLFGINVSHNCSEDVEVRKASYSGNQVVYGDLSDFQRDYLLHEFYNINVLGDRKFETVVVDEVDSMLLDKGNNMLYLSHSIPGLDKLESVFLFIWQWVGSPCGDRDSILASMEVKSIHDAIIYDLYGMIKVGDVKAIDANLSDAHARTIWENMKSSNIIDDRSRLKIEKVDRGTVQKLLSPNFSQYTDRLCYLIDECIYRDRRIHVPNCLKTFVDLHLEKWIINAINAFFMKNGEDYVVDVDRTGTSPDRNPNITIIDKDTGTDQSNSQWDEALHQFLQLKHGCKVSMLSLKAVFISNVSYFKQYVHLYGLTGTLGSKGERKLLEEVHNVDFVTIPTAKPKQFQEYLPKICYSETEWKDGVKSVALDFAHKKNRSVLIICNSVNDVENLYQAFGGKGATNIHTYARDYEEFDVAKSKQELKSGQIIIATNLAGRGTDIKISDELKRDGGLHVVVAYLPKNTRIEQQAFGRAARCGEKGSGQLIVEVTDRKEAIMMNLKNKRNNDELERISEIKNFYENHIKVEEMCFGKFKEQFIQLKKGIDTANHQPSLLEAAAATVTGDNGVAEGLKSVGEATINTAKNAVGVDTRAVPKNVEEILLKSCVDKWAFWLDQNGKLVKDWTKLSSRNSLKSSLNKFLSQMKSFKFEDSKDWAGWLDDNPVAMVELAKHFQQKKSYDAALELLDEVLTAEPHFSEAAHYYKAATLGCKIDWESKPSDNDTDVKKMTAELLCAEKLFEKLSSEALNKAAVVGGMKHENKHSLIQVDAYEEQQKNIANLCRFFSGSISDILGHSVTSASLSSWNIDDKRADTLYKLLIQSEILTPPKVTFGNISETDLGAISCEYDISSALLTSFLHEHDRKVMSSFKEFKNGLKNKILLPSKEAFWKELIKSKMLSQEVKYVVVKLDKLADFDPSLLDTVSDAKYVLKQYSLEKTGKQIFLNTEQVEDQMKNTKVYEKAEFIKHVGRKRYEALKEKEVLAFNRRCDFNLDALKSAANSQPDSFMEKDLIAITNEDERKATIEQLCSDHVIVQESQGIFRVLVDSGAIEKLPLQNKNVKALLKKCTTDLGFRLPHYDSVSVTDLTRNRVSLEDAASILQELEQIRVIKKMPDGDTYRLTAHSTRIEGIRLKTPIYENVTKSVLKISFSYRIALQNMVSRLEKGETAKVSCIRLPTKPHMGLFWSLYDLNVISASKVRVGASKEDIKKAISTLNAELLGKILASSGCIPSEDIGELIENLTTNNWLILSSAGYLVEMDKKKRKSLGESYANCQKTIAKTIDDLVHLADESTIASIDQALDRMKNTLKSLEVPSFGLKPLSKAMAEGDFSMVQELSCFMLNGLGELMVLKEKPYTLKFWRNVACVVVLGLVQIVVGAIINYYSAGAMTHVGNAFMSEGLSDIMYAIGAMRTGYFSWKDYGRHKIQSVALTIVTAGVGAWWSRGTKFSRVGQKVNPTGLTFGGKDLTKETGNVVLNRTNESLLKHVLSTATRKTVEATVFGAANAYVDSTVNNHLQGLGKALAAQILADIDEEVKNHKITDSLERAFRIKGESDAKAMVRELTQQHFAKTSEWETMSSWTAKIFSSVLAGIMEGVAKNQNAGVSSTQLDFIMQSTVKLTALLNHGKNILEIRLMTRRMLDGLAKEINNKLEGGQPDSTQFDQSKYDRFKNDVVGEWREEIRKRSGDIIGQELISPLLKSGVNRLLRYTGRKVKEFYRRYKDQRLYQEFLDLKKQYEDAREKLGDNVEAVKALDEKYWNALDLLSANTCSPKLFAEIIKEGGRLSITCLDPIADEIQYALQSQGIEDGVEINVVKGEARQTFRRGGTSGKSVVINLMIIDKHYVLVDENGQPVPNQSPGDSRSNDCLIHAIAQKIDLGMPVKEVRNRIASRFENDPNLRNTIINGYHRYGILLGLLGGRAHPYEKPNYWEFDEKKDIDLLGDVEYKDGKPVLPNMSDAELNKQLCEANNLSLNKVNEILSGKSKVEGWENVQILGKPLRPEDFKPTMYDTVYTTGAFGKTATAYYPVEMEAIVEVKHGRHTLKYVVTLDMDALTRDQKGPQGPHVGYSIKPYQTGESELPKSKYPRKVVGHCLINTTGNNSVPRRALPSENVPGIVYDPDKYGKGVPNPQDLPRVPPRRLFYLPTRLGSRLQREGDGTESTRNRSFPTSNF